MSRTDARSDSLRRRPSRTVPATIVALVLLGLGVGLVWVAALRLVQGSWPEFLLQAGSWFAALTWGSMMLLLVCVGIAVLGVIVLIAAIKPGAPTAMVIDSAPAEGEGSTEVVMTRRSIARLATARAAEVDGVDAVSAVIGSRKVTVNVQAPSARRGDIEQQVTGRVRDALVGAGLMPMPAITVTVRTDQP